MPRKSIRDKEIEYLLEELSMRPIVFGNPALARKYGILLAPYRDEILIANDRKRRLTLLALFKK